MLVTTLGMDNFDCTKMIAHCKKLTACLQEGLIHEWKQALLAPPSPLMSVNNSQLCSTNSHRTYRFYSIAAQMVNYKVTKKCSKGKQAHVGMERSKTSRTRWERHHNTFTPSLHLVPFCQLCFVFVSCVHRRVEEGSGEGIAVCCAC